MAAVKYQGTRKTLKAKRIEIAATIRQALEQSPRGEMLLTHLESQLSAEAVLVMKKLRMNLRVFIGSSRHCKEFCGVEGETVKLTQQTANSKSLSRHCSNVSNSTACTVSKGPGEVVVELLTNVSNNQLAEMLYSNMPAFYED